MDEAVTETEYEVLLDIPDAVAKDAAPLNTAKVIKGEIHNVLNVMRADTRYASPLRFSEELPLDEHPLLHQFRDLHEKLSLWESAQEPMDVVAYLTPFCSAISERDISASVTGAALSSLHKFLLYGFITQDTTPHAMEGMTLVAKSLLHCTFEEEGASSRRLNTSTHSVDSMDSSRAVTWYDDEQVVLKLLNLAAMVVRSSLQQHAATPLLDTTIVVGLLGTCLHVSHRAKRASPLLKSAAGDALGQIVLVVFHEAPLPKARSTVLSQLATLINPQQYSDETCVTSLTLLNIALETMQQAPTQAEITILQNDLCKHLLQLSTTHDLVIISLTLRVIFNLFQSIRNHLKVPLEVFLTSVHLRILDPSHNQVVSNEHREVALESLLEFCQEPALMQDLYLNYDCDVHCSNLFEMICDTLGKMAVPKTESAPINVLNRLALEGILHVMDSIARRCQGTNSPSGVYGRSFSNLTDTESETNSENLDSAFDDLGDRWKAGEILQERKRHKFVLSEVATEFNVENSDWIRVAQDLELFAQPATPESVARFLYATPHLDKTVVGIYLSKGPAEDYPFHAQVRSSFCGLFDFKDMAFAQALRTFLSRFRLPGEAQCIDRLMEAFADELYQQQLQGPQQEEALELEPNHDGALFNNADAVFTLAFSTIILNTDLHNPSLRDDSRMTLEQFLRNNRGINGGDDFPVDFMTELYTQIKEQEIQVRKELLDLIRRKMLNGDGEEIHAKHWAGILSKSSEVAEPFFTPIETARRNDIQAGIHDRAMFVSISKSVVECVSTVFVRSTDDALVVKALNGFQQMAKICIYFELDETFNEILQILLGHGRDYIMSCIALEYAGYDSNQIMAAGPSSPTSPSKKHVAAVEEPRGPGPVPTILLTTSDESDPVDPLDVNGSAAHRGLLSLDAGFGLVRKQPSKIREAWPTLIECLCALRDARALPDRVIFLDDFADSHGTLLPLSPFAKQSQKRLDEYYRSLSDKEDKKEDTGWFQFPYLFNVHEDAKSKSSKTVSTQDEMDGGDSIPEKELSSFSRSLLAITKRNRLEDVMLMRPKNMPMAKQTIRALLDAVDEYPYFDDPIFEQHAVYSLELALLALISNKDKVQELYPMFLPKFETVLKDDERTANSQASVHLPTPFLMERVVVTILRSCIHLYDYPEVRSPFDVLRVR
jgi:brefeldin A-resistance guanine nucleotide exchange factor 1